MNNYVSQNLFIGNLCDALSNRFVVEPGSGHTKTRQYSKGENVFAGNAVHRQPLQEPEPTKDA